MKKTQKSKNSFFKQKSFLKIKTKFVFLCGDRNDRKNRENRKDG